MQFSYFKRRFWLPHLHQISSYSTRISQLFILGTSSGEGNFTHCGTCYHDETLLIEIQLCFQLNKKLKSFSSFTRVIKFVISKHTPSKSALPNLSSSFLHHLAKISNFSTCPSIKKSYLLLRVTNLVTLIVMYHLFT